MVQGLGTNMKRNGISGFFSLFYHIPSVQRVDTSFKAGFKHFFFAGCVLVHCKAEET